jgi:NTE family protein
MQVEPRQGLVAVGLFSELAETDRAAMAAELERLALARGDVLMRQGDAADALFIVVTGRFEVRIAGRDDVVAEIGPGSPIGEIAFLAGGTRTATVRATRDSVVLKLSRADFDELCLRNPAIWPTLTATLASRLADQTAGRNRTDRPVPRTLALIPAGSSPVPEGFVALLEAAFRAVARTVVVRSSMLDDILGRKVDPTGGEATEALNSLESRYEAVLYIADPDLTPWSEKAIRQADVVLRVGAAEPRTAALVPENAHERLAASLLTPQAQRLVLAYERRRAPQGTRHWLEPRQVGMHHHVALSDRSDVDRLVRFLTGNARGLVACGGGAFCSAHVGIYKAMVEAGVGFDIMGGTSGGSAMTAAFAMGLAPDDIDRVIHDIFVTNGALRRYTWPIYSIFDHTHFDRQVAPYYAGIDIEDLWIPYFAVSTNLSRYALHTHTSGDLWSAVRASGSIPALLPPYYTHDGQMLVDGCLLDNVPVRVMQDMKHGPNVVVAFEVPQLERFEVDYGSLPSRGDLFRRMLTPFRRSALPSAPGLGSVLLRSLMANRQGFEKHLKPDDLLLVPPLPEDMGTLDWHRHGDLIALAYAWTRSEIARAGGEGHPVLADATQGRHTPIARAYRRSAKFDQA